MPPSPALDKYPASLKYLKWLSLITSMALGLHFFNLIRLTIATQVFHSIAQIQYLKSEGVGSPFLTFCDAFLAVRLNFLIGLIPLLLSLRLLRTYFRKGYAERKLQIGISLLFLFSFPFGTVLHALALYLCLAHAPTIRSLK